MTNAKLIEIAKREVSTIFDEATKKTGTNFLIEVEKRKHNSAYVSVKEIVPYSHDYKVNVNGVDTVKTFSGNYYFQVGCGVPIYAISGEKNVIDRIHFFFDR